MLVETGAKEVVLMLCPRCKTKSKVIDTYLRKSNVLRRTRKCPKCGYSFKSVEQVSVEDVRRGNDERTNLRTKW